jgi:hypothetical protein
VDPERSSYNRHSSVSTSLHFTPLRFTGLNRYSSVANFISCSNQLTILCAVTLVYHQPSHLQAFFLTSQYLINRISTPQNSTSQNLAPQNSTPQNSTPQNSTPQNGDSALSSSTAHATRPHRSISASGVPHISRQKFIRILAQS